MSRIRPRRLGAFALACALAVLASVPAGAFPPNRVTAARDWLVTQQQPDGGFEVAGFPGFETPDAALALAIAGQPKRRWSTTAALSAVEAVQTGGRSALNWAGDFAEGPITAGQAAKLVVLVAGPTGLDPTSFDPDGDGVAVDLPAKVDAGFNPVTGWYGSFTATLFAVLATRAVGRAVPTVTVQAIRDAQEAGGGWNFAGDPSGNYADADTTGYAIQALIAAGAGASDPAVSAGLRFLALTHEATTGAWQSFGSDDPNSTALAILAVTAAGHHPAKRCWRDAAAPERAGDPYVNPLRWLRSQQQPDGRIASPADLWGVNTFATSQAVQALARTWLPLARLSRVSCP
jgi:hypothetical protein